VPIGDIVRQLEFIKKSNRLFLRRSCIAKKPETSFELVFESAPFRSAHAVVAYASDRQATLHGVVFDILIPRAGHAAGRHGYPA